MIFLNVKSTNDFDSIEFHVTVDDIPVEGFLGIGMYYNWIALPKMGVCCELAHFSDSYWNYNSLFDVIKDERTVKIVLDVISRVYPLLVNSNQTKFDGYNFISVREYLFKLESNLEYLSSKLLMYEDEEDITEECLNAYTFDRLQIGKEPI